MISIRAVIATSGPSSNYPQRAYRNPLDALVTFLDNKHGKDWCIWEFRAEGTGYPDSEVYGRIHHFPWPDHHPPPFVLIPAIMGSMRNWIYKFDDKDSEGKSKGSEKRVAVVHCKAGKGRSGTVACGYLISEEGWKLEDALQRFTERRMRVGFGAGVSIPSQLRWVGYINRWAKEMEKRYVERPVEILELHVWGLRDGVKVAVEGFVDQGKKIKCFHLFHRSERTVVDDGKTVPAEKRRENQDKRASKEPVSASSTQSTLLSPSSATDSGKDPMSSSESGSSITSPRKRISAIILRPSKPIILPSSDVNIDFERRSKAAYTGWAMVTSIAHIWFNAYFEGGDKYESGVFETEWDALDGIKGTTKKGIKALDRLKVVWRYPPPSRLGMKEPGKEDIGPAVGKTVPEPNPGEPIPESQPADWRGEDPGNDPDRCLRNQENIFNRIAGKQDDDSQCLSTSSEHPYLSSASTTAATAASVTARQYHGLKRDLGLRKQEDESKDVSLANSEDEGQTIRREIVAKLKAEETSGSDSDKDAPAVQPYYGSDGAGYASGHNSNTSSTK